MGTYFLAGLGLATIIGAGWLAWSTKGRWALASPPCERQWYQKVTNPWAGVAIVAMTNCAEGSDRTEISLGRDVDEFLSGKVAPFFVTDGQPNIKAVWTGASRLSVLFVDRVKITRREPRVGDIEIQYNITGSQ